MKKHHYAQVNNIYFVVNRGVISLLCMRTRPYYVWYVHLVLVERLVEIKVSLPELHTHERHKFMMKTLN